jgi:hypothetical protein
LDPDPNPVPKSEPVSVPQRQNVAVPVPQHCFKASSNSHNNVSLKLKGSQILITISL